MKGLGVCVSHSPHILYVYVRERETHTHSIAIGHNQSWLLGPDIINIQAPYYAVAERD